MTGAALILDETGCQRTLGYVLELDQPEGCARCWLEVTEAHRNRFGALHGGLIGLLMDSAMGATASLTVDPAGKAPFLTVSLGVQYLAPARSGRVTATGRITGAGASLRFVEGVLHDAQGTVLATATGIFKRVPPQALQAEAAP